MITKKQWILFFGLLIAALSIRFFSASKLLVENSYSGKFYPFISKILRFLFGWLPFSIGDLLYGIVFFMLLWKMVKFIKAVFKKEIDIASFKKKLYKLMVVLMIVYCVFNIFWGINYNRKGIAAQLGLVNEKYSKTELRIIDSILLQKVNESKAALLYKKNNTTTTSQIFSEAVNAYKEVDKQYPFLNYNTISVKPSMWGWLGNYLGFTGYYNPFTGEANVNTTVPLFLQPYTTCHEMGHQLGYAKEDEANFVGYLAASASKDTLFNYSVYLDLFIYANRTLYNVDSASAKNFAKQLLPETKADLLEWKKFMMKHKNPVEPAIRWMYGKYLQSNQQPTGVLSYDEVTGLLIAYYKKFGSI